MRIEATTKWIPPKSTNTDPSYYESIYTVTGSLSEVDDFQRHIDNYHRKESHEQI